MNANKVPKKKKKSVWVVAAAIAAGIILLGMSFLPYLPYILSGLR